MGNRIIKSKPTASTSKELNSTSYLSELPLDLMVLIASYCSMKDHRTFSHCKKSYRSIMRTANLIRCKLSKESCKRYVDDLSFRDVVDSRGHVWDFSLFNPAMLLDVSFLSRVHKVKLECCRSVIDVFLKGQIAEKNPY